jgi:hypothetical protein
MFCLCAAATYVYGVVAWTSGAGRGIIQTKNNPDEEWGFAPTPNRAQ